MQCNALSVVNARWNVHLQRVSTAFLAATAALLAWGLDDLTRAVTIRALRRGCKRTERGALCRAHLTGAVTIRAVLRMRAAGSAAAAAFLTILYAIHRNLLIAAKNRFLKRNHNGFPNRIALSRCIGAAASAATAKAAEATAKEAAENIAQIDILEAAKAASRAACAIVWIHSGKAELVIAGALLLVGKDSIRFSGLLKLFCRFGVVFI